MPLRTPSPASFVFLQTRWTSQGASGEELASRLHLSRFHADRLVAAVAGEPPGALRRRILLERAAYRLLASGDDLLAIALCGLFVPRGVHAGIQAGVWESTVGLAATPTRLQVPAPNGVHFNPPGGIRLTAEGKVTAMDLIQRMVEHHVWLLGELTARAETLQADVLDAPIRVFC